MDRFKKIAFYEYYYIAVALGYVFTLAYWGFRPGVFATVLMLLAAGEWVIKKQWFPMKLVDWIVLAYFLYLGISGIWLVSYGQPFSLFSKEFISSALPVIFYFFGRVALTGGEGNYKKFLYGFAILGLVGILLYIWAPQFYIDYAYAKSFISKADVPTMRVRLCSVTDSTVLGALSVVAMLVSGLFLMKSDKRNRIFGGIFLIFSFAIAFMSSQRSAMFVGIMILLYLNILVFFVFKWISKKWFVLEVALIVVAFAAVAVFQYDLFYKFAARLLSLPDSIGQRSEQWVRGVNNMHSFWIGNGLGANGHHAIGLPDTYPVADGGLVKMFCETGILGFSLFVYSMLLLLGGGFKRMKDCFSEVGILLAMLLISIGSNVLCFQPVAPIFWFAAGTLATKTMKETLD